MSRFSPKAIADTQLALSALLRDARCREFEMETEYSTKVKAFMREIDASLEGNLTALQIDLNCRREQLAKACREEMQMIQAADVDPTQQLRAMAGTTNVLTVCQETQEE